MSELPLTPIGRIIKNGGAARVSEDAKVALADILEEEAVAIAQLALENAKANGRKTLKAEDIETVFKTL